MVIPNMLTLELFLGTGLSPKQAMIKANTKNPDETHHYDKYVTVKTTKEEDAKIKVAAKAAASAEKYCVIGQSCVTVMTDSFNALVNSRTNNAWYVPQHVEPMPNVFVGNFKNTLRYYNTLFVPSEVKIESRKVGKLEIGLVTFEGIGKNDKIKTP